jgi:ABC-type lipoprotein export system ATPase subunit
MKIKELQLYNFKFFTDKDNKLNINSKNVLIWGENGSGKSSIYWAIYTLLQCSFKDKAGIDAYFTHGHEKSLRNIFARKNGKSFVKMTLDDGSSYRIGFKDYSAIGNKDLQLGSISTDFIDYNALSTYLRFMHGHIPDQFSLFEEQLFRFMEFRAPAPYNVAPHNVAYFDKAWEAVDSELQIDLKTKKYPSSGSTGYDHYNSLVTEFNRQLAQEIGLMNVRANKILQQKFEYPIEIELKYTAFEFVVNRLRTEFKKNRPSIILNVNEYYGKKNAVPRPQSFLNEAKKTAIGLALRLALLERRLLADKLNVLALDDLLVSLDMSNRQIVLTLLLEEYQKNYQLLIFTHDKQFYNLTKRIIETQYKKVDWFFWEMYENNLNAQPKPYFKPEKDSVLVAEDFLVQNDFPSAGIYLRKELEKLLVELLPEALRKEAKTENGVTKMIDKKLNDQIIAMKTFCEAEGIDYSPFVNLKIYKDLILNPLAHSDDATLLFRDEMKKLIAIVKVLQKVKRGRLFLSSNKNFVLNKPSGEYFSVRMKTQERVVLLEEEGKSPRISIYCKCIVNSIDNNGIKENNAEQFDTIKDAYEEMCRRFAFATNGNFSDAFIYDGKTFATKLGELNNS